MTSREWYYANKERIALEGKNKYALNKEAIRKRRKELYAINRDHLLKNKRKDYKKNPQKYLERCKKWCKENREKVNGFKREYYNSHKEQKALCRKRNLPTQRKYIKARKQTDPVFKLTVDMRNRLLNAFKGKGWKKGKSQVLLGCTWEEVKAHIESQFKEGMTWNNHNKTGWHIDHKIGLCTATTEEGLIKLCHYTNLQPLWATENLTKPKR